MSLCINQWIAFGPGPTFGSGESDPLPSMSLHLCQQEQNLILYFQSHCVYIEAMPQPADPCSDSLLQSEGCRS